MNIYAGKDNLLLLRHHFQLSNWQGLAFNWLTYYERTGMTSFTARCSMCLLTDGSGD
jgi:hypothetical protein